LRHGPPQPMRAKVRLAARGSRLAGHGARWSPPRQDWWLLLLAGHLADALELVGREASREVVEVDRQAGCAEGHPPDARRETRQLAIGIGATPVAALKGSRAKTRADGCSGVTDESTVLASQGFRS